jgi:hypothetical protein
MFYVEAIRETLAQHFSLAAMCRVSGINHEAKVIFVAD